MIIDFSNIGGGGGGYVLPVATSNTLGGVKIGEGINVDSAGTISVEEFNIPVVESLPASGTDGQMVLLDTILPEMHIHITGTGNGDRTTSITATGITVKTKLFDFNHWNTLLPVYVNPDSSYTIFNTFTDEDLPFPVDSATTYTVSDGNGHNVIFTGTVTTTGCVFTYSTFTNKVNVIPDIDQLFQEIQVLYTWSDSPELTADIDYTIESGSDWCVRFKYSELPNNTIIVTKYANGNNYYHYVYNNGELRMYESASADTYTATTYQTVAKYGVITNVGRSGVYWTDDDLVFFYGNSGHRNSINLNAFNRTGWHKYLGHRVSNKAFYKDYTWFDEDYNIIIKNPSYIFTNKTFRINGSSTNVYTNNADMPAIYAPTTSATTGYVCVAGNGNTAPTWVSPETITNGVKFWKGTQNEYDAIGEGNYDSSTLYIIAEE